MSLKTYFTTVIDWIDAVFTAPPDKAMRGLDWGALYETYHHKSYKADEIDADLQEPARRPGREEPQGHLRVLARRQGRHSSA